MQTVTVLNASLSAKAGNTFKLLERVAELLSSKVRIVWLDLIEPRSIEKYKTILHDSSGFVFGTGTYWDSWSSPLQKFFEDTTDFEASAIWIGKPAAVIVSMHSVGGKGVLSRLQGVLSSLGLLIPPMSGLVYSAANQLALEQESPVCEDLWCPDDLEVVAHNLLEALKHTSHWRAWPVRREGVNSNWLKL